ncbi:YqhA family protein [Methanococcus sp. CF]
MEESEKIKEKYGIKDIKEQGLLEHFFELALWNSRFIVTLAVIFGTLGSITLFLAGSVEIFHTIIGYFSDPMNSEQHNQILIGVIGAVDLYLIGVVLLIFSFGIYELFISKIDIARADGEVSNILEIYTLDELKSKIIKVIIMVLIVSFFQRVLSMHFETSLDMIYMAISIFAISIGVYYLQKQKM